MRTLAVALLGAGLLLFGACSSDDGEDAAPDDGATSTSAPAPDADPDADPDPGERSAPAGTPSACTEVTLGIDAFNAGDYDETVEHFEAAVPIAEKAYADDDSDAARLLLDAVKYYAELAPDDYLAASTGSPEFLLYKEITLTQCAYDGGGGPAEPEPTGIPA